MWIDADTKFANLITSIDEDKIFPITCTVCGEKSVHVYMHRFSNESPRGGAWVWCSSCKNYAHLQYHIPDWWTNINSINIDDLCSEPKILEDKKVLIDNWINSIKK